MSMAGKRRIVVSDERKTQLSSVEAIDKLLAEVDASRAQRSEAAHEDSSNEERKDDRKD